MAREAFERHGRRARLFHQRGKIGAGHDLAGVQREGRAGRAFGDQMILQFVLVFQIAL